MTHRLTRCTALLALVLAACGRADTSPADVVIVNAKVFPADGSERLAEARAIRGSQIVAVGAEAEIAIRRPGSRRARSRRRPRRW